MAMVAEGLTCETRDENRMDNGHFLVRQRTTIIDWPEWLVGVSEPFPVTTAFLIENDLTRVVWHAKALRIGFKVSAGG